MMECRIVIRDGVIVENSAGLEFEPHKIRIGKWFCSVSAERIECFNSTDSAETFVTAGRVHNFADGLPAGRPTAFPIDPDLPVSGVLTFSDDRIWPDFQFSGAAEF